MYYAEWEGQLLWSVFFATDKLMDLCIIGIVIHFIQNWKLQNRLIVYTLLVIKLIEIGGDIAGEIESVHQQGNWAHHFAHAYGIIASIALTGLLLSNQKQILSWFKSRLKF